MWTCIHTPGIHINTKLTGTDYNYNGVIEEKKTEIVRTRIFKQSYRQALTTRRRARKKKRKPSTLTAVMTTRGTGRRIVPGEGT